mgnify:CR=1 FL=1
MSAFTLSLIEKEKKRQQKNIELIASENFVSDDEKAVVGTINLDFRSMFLHFECAAYLYKVPVLQDIKTDFQETIKKSQLITLYLHYNQIKLKKSIKKQLI